MQETGISPIQLVKTRKDTPKMLDFVDKALHQMAFTVQPAVVVAQHLGTLMGWNDRFNATSQQVFDEMRRRVSSVGNQPLEIEALKQLLSLRDVVLLACRQTQAQRIAQRIDRHMDFSGEAASAASERLLALFFSAPAAHGWARMIVLSIIPFSMSGSAAK